MSQFRKGVLFGDEVHDLYRYANEHDFIHLVNNEGDAVRNFGSKVKAFNAGNEALGSVEYEYIGNDIGQLW